MRDMKEYTINEDDDGIRLDRWFKRHYAGLPHALLEKYLRKGNVRLDGKKAKTSDRLQLGQILSCPEITVETVQRPRPKLDEQEIKDIRKWVLYQDKYVIIINKPFGLAVQGGTKIQRSLDDVLDALAEPGKERPKLVHRLDRDTSGVLVLARSSKAAGILAKAFAGKTVEKIYWAITNGSPLPMKGTVNLPLAKMAKNPGGREQVHVDQEEGKYAETEFQVLDSLIQYALVELKPITGRTHQLRVHMTAIGHPILGDNKYGGETDKMSAIGIDNNLHLHARRIIIPSIGLGKKIDVTAPLPPHMVKSFKALGLDLPKKE